MTRATCTLDRYHGLGNDFLLLDAAALEGLDPGQAARALCDRHRGVGADGLLLASRADPGGRWRMTVRNADGSQPQMCGNGLRCFARWLVDSGRVALAQARAGLVIETDAGALRARLLEDPTIEAPVAVEIELGQASFERASLPMDGVGESVEALDLGGERVVVRGLSLGNPHAVARRERDDTLEAARRLGPLLSAHPRFPQQVNASFAHLRPDGTVALAVHERGCGVTQACGTGAAATVAALAREEPGLRGRPVAVDLPGGRLHIRVEDGGDPARPRLWLDGPAERVARLEVARRWLNRVVAARA